MVDLWWTYGGPMVDLWWTYGGPMVDLWWTYGGPMVTWESTQRLGKLQPSDVALHRSQPLRGRSLSGCTGGSFRFTSALFGVMGMERGVMKLGNFKKTRIIYRNSMKFPIILGLCLDIHGNYEKKWDYVHIQSCLDIHGNYSDDVRGSVAVGGWKTNRFKGSKQPQSEHAMSSFLLKLPVQRTRPIYWHEIPVHQVPFLIQSILVHWWYSSCQGGWVWEACTGKPFNVLRFFIMDGCCWSLTMDFRT